VGAGLSRPDPPRAGGGPDLTGSKQSMKLIVGGLGPAARLVATAWREAWAALILASVSIGAFLAATDGGPARRCAWLAVALLASLPAQGAVYRLALARPGIGPGGLQWGHVERRLLVVWLLTALFIFILGLLLFIVLIASAYAVASAGAGFVAAEPSTWARAVDGRGRFALGAVAAIGIANLLWARMRICLGPAASVARGRVQVLSAWPITRGRAWPIAAAAVLISVGPGLLLAALAFGILPAAGKSAGIRDLADMAQGLVIAGLWLPLDVGLMTYFFRRLAADRPDNPAAP